MVAERRAHQLTLGGRRIRRIGVAIPLRALLQVHPPRQQVGRGDTVGERVVNLADDRDPAVGQAFDEVHLPQRVAAVQRRGGDLADGLVQLATTAGAFHPPRPHVIVQVDIAVLPPHRVVELEGNIDKLVAEGVEFVQPAV